MRNWERGWSPLGLPLGEMMAAVKRRSRDLSKRGKRRKKYLPNCMYGPLKKKALAQQNAKNRHTLLLCGRSRSNINFFQQADIVI